MRTQISQEKDVALVRRVLSRYGMGKIEAVKPIVEGENSANFAVVFSERGRIFVKVVHGEKAMALRESSRRAEFARRVGVDTPRPFQLGTRGHVIESEGHAIAFWEWADGAVRSTGWAPEEADAAGVALARIHREWRKRFPRSVSDVSLTQWAGDRLDEATAATERIEQWARLRLGAVRSTASRDHYARILDHVRWRRRTLPDLRSAMERRRVRLNVQELHGDYSVPNLLFHDEHRLTVTDFADSARAPVAYEIGRIAYAPQFVAAFGVYWQRNAIRLTEAYRREGGASHDSDIRAAKIVMTIHFASSYYGADAHVDDSGTTNGLEQFWWQRVRALQNMTESTLAGES